MVGVTHLTSPAMLATSSGHQLSVMSYNVLLPNSVDGWWNYKMYYPPLTGETLAVSSWEYRKELLRKRIGLIDADVVCLQEVSPVSFEEDFKFMKEDLGYDGMELFKKGRFRPATFWKTDRCHLVSPAVHKDRTLLTSFSLPLQVTQKDDNRHWHVLNCHLQAGNEAPRRLRQIHEGVSAVFKLAKKLKEKQPESPWLVVCGDFNGGTECGAVRYCEDGLVDPTFMEDGKSITSKVKASPLSEPLIDVPQQDAENGAPPTMVVPELISLMVAQSSSQQQDEDKTMTESSKTAYEPPTLSKMVLERLEHIYKRYATTSVRNNDGDDDTLVMGVADVEKWLIAINQQLGRGSEFRTAAKEMGWIPDEDDEKKRIELPRGGVLTLKGFQSVYETELNGGKFWGIAYDLAVLGEPLPTEDAGLFSGRYDRMYCSSSLQPLVVLNTLSSDRACPNEVEPSDHLPVAASFIPR